MPFRQLYASPRRPPIFQTIKPRKVNVRRTWKATCQCNRVPLVRSCNLSQYPQATNTIDETGMPFRQVHEAPLRPTIFPAIFPSSHPYLAGQATKPRQVNVHRTWQATSQRNMGPLVRSCNLSHLYPCWGVNF